jgi:hypothetical protein
MSQMFEVVIKATGEVRDADGNLISSTPIEARTTMTAEQIAALTQGDTP